MATPERIQQLITAPASNCQQIASSIIALPQPKKNIELIQLKSTI